MIDGIFAQRTLMIKIGQKTASAFLHRERGHMFLISAKHAFDGVPTDFVDVFMDNDWRRMPIQVRMAPYKVDLCVALLNVKPIKLSTEDTNVIYSPASAPLGELLYAVGYPLALYSVSLPDSPKFPVPLVSLVNCAAIPLAQDGQKFPGLYLSGSLDSGYSGGPVVRPYLSHVVVEDDVAEKVKFAPVAQKSKPQVLGFVSQTIRRRIEERSEGKTTIVTSHPSGIVHAVDSRYGKNLIDSWLGELTA